MNIENKFENLKNIILSSEKAAVAFSGGVDSSFLAKFCYDLLRENSAAITIASPMMPAGEIEEAKEIAHLIGIDHYIIEDNSIDEEIASNSSKRCYYCKKMEFSKIKQKASELGINNVFDGSNMDDLSDYRPGLKALQEVGIVSPLREIGLTKTEIRELSKKLGLKTWDKPAYACLASRIPYGEKITKEKLELIDKAEAYLKNLGFRQYRVRYHGTIARIEIAAQERKKMFDENLMDNISRVFKAFGFIYVALELEGYQTGSLNRTLEKGRADK